MAAGNHQFVREIILLTELAVRVLCDSHPSTPADGAYLFAQTVDNQESVLAVGRDLIDQGRVQDLLISAAGAISGYPGGDKWLQALKRLRVPSQRLKAIKPHTAEILHTRVEAEALVRYARTRGYKSIIVVSAPFHQLRTFMTTVSVALEEVPELSIYSQVGAMLPWNVTVTHSQGSLALPRSGLIQTELERIERYQQKGDLAPTEAILAYLQQRDERP